MRTIPIRNLKFSIFFSIRHIEPLPCIATTACVAILKKVAVNLIGLNESFLLIYRFSIHMLYRCISRQPTKVIDHSSLYDLTLSYWVKFSLINSCYFLYFTVSLFKLGYSNKHIWYLNMILQWNIIIVVCCLINK